MKRVVLLTILLTLVVAAFSVSITSAQDRTTRRYIVISQSQTSVASSLLGQIQTAGGRVLKNFSNMGLVVVSSNNPNFESSIAAAKGVALDMRVSSPPVQMKLGPDLAAARVPGPPNSTETDRYFNLDWGVTAVDAQNAWAQGRRGAGALVAILDEGVDATHPDLAPNVRKDLGTSFAEDCNGNIENWQPDPGFYFVHGTHVAGIVAAAENGTGIIGVAPQAQIMPVDVLSRCLHYGLDSWILDGIRYAADHGADVINMSLGSGPLNTHGACDENGCYTAQDVANLFLAYSYAALYANSKGATVIASAGNEGFDFGANPQYINLPSDAVGILSVSATGPVNWGANPNTNLDLPAGYSNFGAGRIDFSAPGGNDQLYNEQFDPVTGDPLPNATICQVAGVTQYCAILDWVFSDIPGGYSWAAGTSMASPHVSGVAAQIIGAAGGRLSPILVEAALRLFADHPNGNRGRDAFYGFGRVDATLLDPRH